MKYFSVTQVLSVYSDFSQVSPEKLQYAADRGTRVHAACAAFAEGFWVPGLPDDCQGYFQSFRKWYKKHVLQVFWCEKELKNDDLGYFGHPDIYCELNSNEKLIVDYKTPATESPTWRAQIAAYCNLAGVDSGMVLKLKSNGNPATAIRYQKTSTDYAAFVSALNAYRYFKS